MPLLDHFRAPLFPHFHWESFHSHWASILTNQLNGGCLPPEYIAVDLNEALRAVGEVIGAVDVEQILDSVFGQFCIGK